MLTALVVAALIAGVAGAWSPCGFSMVDTLAPHGYARRRLVSALACAAFAAGALAGGVATFGGLALLGDALGTGGAVAIALVIAALLVAAAGDAAGRRIVPQIRRQVPESWRRLLPVALAAALYGVLLGLGFTTFVLSFAVYALAAACLALGDPALGVLVGVAFAAGRSVPVVVLAPLQETDRGAVLAAAMGERPAVLRAIRASGAVALGAAALALALGGAPAQARTYLITAQGTDPGAGAAGVVWQEPGAPRSWFVRPGGLPAQLPGTDPALSATNLVWRAGDELVVAREETLTEVVRVRAPNAEEVAVSDIWLVWREREPDGEVLRRLDLLTPGAQPIGIRRVRGTDRLGRPSLDFDRVVYHLAQRSSSAIEEIYLPGLRREVLRSSRRGALLLNPSMHDGQLLYISSSAQRQALMLGPRRARDGRQDRTLYRMHPTVRRDAGAERGRSRHGAGYPGGRPPRLPSRAPRGGPVVLWSTALASGRAYVSRTRTTSGGTSSEILGIDLP